MLAVCYCISIVDFECRMKMQNLPEQLSVARGVINPQRAVSSVGPGIAGQGAGNRDGLVAAIHEQHEVLLDKCAATDMAHLFELSVDGLVFAVWLTPCGRVVLSEVFVTFYILNAVSNTFHDLVATSCHVCSWVVVVLNAQRPQAAPKVL